MSLIDNLNAINKCKIDIKRALVDKGVDMTDVKFSEYAGKIDALTFEPGGDSPTPSADYIYSNGYMKNEDGTPSTTPDIVTYVSYEIPEINVGESYEYVLFGPLEFQGYAKGDDGSLFDYPDIVFGVDVPQQYSVDIKVWSNDKYVDCGVKKNKRHEEIIRDGVKYNSYVKGVDSGYFYDDATYVDPSVEYKYKIIITKIV
jgi:hypothetical protein